jgi:hypothetical protein
MFAAKSINPNKEQGGAIAGFGEHKVIAPYSLIWDANWPSSIVEGGTGYEDS